MDNWQPLADRIDDCGAFDALFYAEFFLSDRGEDNVPLPTHYVRDGDTYHFRTAGGDQFTVVGDYCCEECGYKVLEVKR